jgi:hypothetical protein
VSKDELRKDVKQLQEVVLNVANMCHEVKQQLAQLQEDHSALKKQFLLAAATGLHVNDN